jgi:GNAT superfamily N-acetyltransferase
MSIIYDICHIKSNDILGKYSEELVELYVNIYCKSPYFKHVNKYDVLLDFVSYMNDGMFLALLVKDHPIGFICLLKAHDTHYANILTEDKIKTIISKKIEYNTCWYLSELAVHEDFRGKGAGSKLMNHIHKHIDTAIFLRTGVKNNDNIINFYQKRGYVKTEIYENVENLRIDKTKITDKRLYMINLFPCR